MKQHSSGTQSAAKHACKMLRPLVRFAEKAGWTITLRNAGHLTWTPPDKDRDFVITSRTPSDRRALDRIKRDLRNVGGLDIPR